MYTRYQQRIILESLKPDFVVVLYGARRTGKTVLMNSIREEIGENDVLYVTGDDLEVAEILSSQKIATLQRFTKNYKYLFIDEAQTIPNIGKSLKLMVDNIHGLHIFITGSSALDISNQTGEPLTGRSIFLHLFPLAQMELNENLLQMKQGLEERLIYGFYPQVITANEISDKLQVLQSIKNGYLLKDILMLDNLKNSVFILDLLRLIAFQIGNDISLSELANQLHVNVRTVKRYLDIFEKAFILLSLRGFSRNLRKEINKSPRYYFWDNGIRNIIISNFNDLKNRNDHGQLWENFCISERMKYQHYTKQMVNNFFWRTYDQQEIDLIEETGGQLYAYEFKWNKKPVKIPVAFKNAYQNFTFQTINRENYYDFIGV